MRDFEATTDDVATFALEPEVRAYFTATGIRFKEKVWLRVETRWVAGDAPLHVVLTSEGEDEDPATELELDASLQDGVWEKEWTAELAAERLDAIAGPIYLRFSATIDGVAQPAHSQWLMLHRTRFSS